MSSKTIYPILPYVYKLQHPETGEIYIGYRSANKLQSHLDLPNYKTSSKKVKPRFEEFGWTIIAEFFISDDAYDFEQLCIHEEWDNPLLLNDYCHYKKARLRNKGHSDETKAKMSACTKGVPKKRVSCPHCIKIGSVSNMTRHHFENCKLKPPLPSE